MSGRFFAYDSRGILVQELSRSNEEYYQTILKIALGSQFTATDPKTDRTDPQPCVIGQLSAGAPGTQILLKQIAEIESGYYFRWLPSPSDEVALLCFLRDNPVDANARDETVPKFTRINAHTLCKIKDVGGQLLGQLVDAKGDEVIVHELNNIQLTFDVRNDEVWVQGARALYLDTNKKTRRYRFESADGSFHRSLTWRPGKGSDDHPAAAWDYFQATDGRHLDDGRALFYQYEELKAGAVTKKRGVYRNFASLKKAANELLGALPAGKRRRVEEQVSASAERSAQQIPDRCHCLYVGGNQHTPLWGLIYSKHLPRHAPGGGNYEMRADPASEMPYRWSIGNGNKEDNEYASRLARICRLHDSEQWLHRNTPTGYKPTNTPVIANWGPLRYYKKFPQSSTGKSKKNLPLDPRAPRTGDFKPAKGEVAVAAYLKWKKGEDYFGEPWTEAQLIGERSDAGSIMAAALSRYEFYEKAVEYEDKMDLEDDERHSGLSYSKAPATAFARYVANNDDTARKSWNRQVLREKDPTPDDILEVRTDQEWCHLFGHGDGGHEVRDNLVSGSEHCNTEQLAIEIGQRRVTRNNHIDPEIRSLIKWKITAHLVTNDGTLRKGKRDELIKDCYGTYEPPVNVRSVIDDALEQKTVLDALLKVASAIKDRSSQLKDKKMDPASRRPTQLELTDLFRFHRQVEHHFGIVFPLARMIHYRIFYDGEKCFEHYFDAQSESFDVHEARILDYTVELALYRALQRKDVKIQTKEGPVSAIAYYDALLDKRLARGPRDEEAEAAKPEEACSRKRRRDEEAEPRKRPRKE